LLVEDEAAIAVLLEETFGDAGFEVVFASYGDEALVLLDSMAGPPDVLVTDINLGRGPTGLDVARRARELHPDLPIVFITGHAELEPHSCGFDDALVCPKPFIPWQFAEKVRAHLEASAAPD
jgi:DNA-binding response OmpR family regulator